MSGPLADDNQGNNEEGHIEIEESIVTAKVAKLSL